MASDIVIFYVKAGKMVHDSNGPLKLIGHVPLLQVVPPKSVDITVEGSFNGLQLIQGAFVVREFFYTAGADGVDESLGHC